MLGRQEPTRHVAPSNVFSSDISKAQALLPKGGINLLPWQASLMGDWLSRNAAGRWAAASCGLSVPRQNGKTVDVAARCCYGMLAYGEWVIYTAHLQKTATETFEQMRAFFEMPAMAKYVKEIKTALGREEIRLKDPKTGKERGRVKFLARTRNGGRGQHGDLLIFDEAQCLDDDQQASFIPCLAASRNPQTLYLGTPPDDAETASPFRRIRAKALDGSDGTISWSEWGIEYKGETGNVDDWATANPSYGYMIMHETIEGERGQLAPDKFARERLGWWSDAAANRDAVISASDWDACCTEMPPIDGTTVFAVKFEGDGSSVALAAAVKSAGVPYVELIEHRSMANGLAWIADWLAERKTDAAQIVIDGASYKAALAEKLAGRVPAKAIVLPNVKDAISAYAGFADAVKAHEVEHMGQQQLTDSATKCEKRKIGNDGGFGFKSNEEAEACPVEAAALALWQVNLTKRNPKRKQRIG